MALEGKLQIHESRHKEKINYRASQQIMMAIFGMLSIPLNIALENLEQVGFEGGKDIKNEDTSACIISRKRI